jgi:CheY-like chemotaxis protein
LKARALTQQLITFADGGAPVRRTISLMQVIEESTRVALSGSGVGCEFSLADDLWSVSADEGQMGQVIRNMVLNAREAMPRGGTIFIRAENTVLGAHDLRSLPAGQYIRLSIEDRGGGIAKEVLPKIFDPYFSTKERGQQKGMGLGLTICHTVVKKHGGAIAVESKVGVGTTFHVYLPACREMPRDQNAPAVLTRPRTGRILVMDDEVDVRTVISVWLEMMGHEVELAADGQGAVEAYMRAKAAGRPFDAVLLDLTVRDGTGGRVAILELLKIDPAVKAIVMSGYTHDPIILEPERYGFKGVLAKPIESKSLRAVFARVLGPERGDHYATNHRPAG